MQDNRQELLDSIDELEKSQNGLDFKTIVHGISILLIIVVLCAPKIYLTSSIYFVSAQINMALDSSRSLKEENIHLRKKLELLRYRDEIEASLPQ